MDYEGSFMGRSLWLFGIFIPVNYESDIMMLCLLFSSIKVFELGL